MLDLVQQLNALQVKAESLGNDCKDVKKFIGETSYKVVTSRYRKKKEESKQKKRLLTTRMTNFFHPQNK